MSDILETLPDIPVAKWVYPVVPFEIAKPEEETIARDTLHLLASIWHKLKAGQEIYALPGVKATLEDTITSGVNIAIALVRANAIVVNKRAMDTSVTEFIDEVLKRVEKQGYNIPVEESTNPVSIKSATQENLVITKEQLDKASLENIGLMSDADLLAFHDLLHSYTNSLGFDLLLDAHIYAVRELTKRGKDHKIVGDEIDFRSTGLTNKIHESLPEVKEELTSKDKLLGIIEMVEFVGGKDITVQVGGLTEFEVNLLGEKDWVKSLNRYNYISNLKPVRKIDQIYQSLYTSWYSNFVFKEVYNTLESLPDWVRKMPQHAQEIFRSAFNSAFEQYKGNEVKAFRVAIAAVKSKYEKKESGWVVKETAG